MLRVWIVPVVLSVALIVEADTQVVMAEYHAELETSSGGAG